jgi:hypothetical protein
LRPFGLLAALALAAMPCAAPADDAAAPPLSPAQVALFETPHLHAITAPETLEYRFERTGGDAFTDTVAVQILEVHPDGTKLVNFNFLNGERHEFYPSVDDFAGNPLLMVFLEHDVHLMKDRLGIAGAYFRDGIRNALVDHATVKEIEYQLAGRTLHARRITVKPFADDKRLEHLPSIQQKEYGFVVSDDAPGELLELSASMPADAGSGAPAWSERLSFVKETK